MKYERLTKSGSEYITNDGEHDIIVELDKNRYENPQYDYDSICEKLNSLVELEDKIEQGTLIELPCKVGDTVYVPWIWDGVYGVATVKIEEIKFYDTQMHYMFFIDMDSDDKSYNQEFGGWKIDQSIGETVFLTREEAEKRLLELQGETKL